MTIKILASYVFRFWKIPNAVIDRINPWCEPFVIASPAILGSVTAFWISGTMILCLVRTMSGVMAITKRRPLLIIAAVYALWFIIHVIFGLAHSRSAETLSEIVETLTFLAIPLLYAGLALTPPQKLVWPTEFAASTGAIIALIVAVYQYLNGWPRAEGLIGNPGPFALMTLLLYGYCLVGIAQFSGRKQLFLSVGAIAAFICVILSGMRGVWFGLAFIPVIVAIIYRREIFDRISVGQFFLAGLVAVAVVAAMVPVADDRVRMFLAEYGTLGENLNLRLSVDQHVALWTAGISLIMEAPFAGHGLDVIPLMSNETKELYGEAFALSHFHNAFIDIGVKTGVTGIIVLAAMVALPLYLTALGRKSDMGRFGFAMICVLMISYVLSGATGLMLGHDIHDTVFVFGVTYWSVFAFEADNANA